MILSKSVPSTSAVVVIQDLVQMFMKRRDKSFFQQQYTAVDHLSFYVPQGSCFGLLGTYSCRFTMDFFIIFLLFCFHLGTNGAGKTTTFRVLINDIEPTSGDISIRKIVGIFPLLMSYIERTFSFDRTIQKLAFVHNSIGL